MKACVSESTDHKNKTCEKTSGITVWDYSESKRVKVSVIWYVQ